MTSLTAVGDLSFGDHYAAASIGIDSHLRKHNFINLLAGVADRLKSSSLVFGNLETVLSEAGLDRKNLNSMHMRGHPQAIETLVSSGFNLVNVANNHILQHGVNAFHETIELLKDREIGVVGLAGSDGMHCVPHHVQLNGQEVVFLGYGFEKDKYFRNRTLYAFGQEETVIDDIRRYKSKNNQIVCSFHWGYEFITYPNMDQVRLARRVVDSGCSLVLGHHPHVLNGYERWNDGLIFYSLGNFLFDQLWNPLCREGCVIELEMQSTRFEIVRSWATKIGLDFSVQTDGNEVDGHCRFEALNKQLELAIASACASYESDKSSAETSNRYQSWLHLLRHVRQYDKRILLQIISDTLHKKLPWRNRSH
jgi:gamma-polyglutamate biosynthesis protein CapA